MRKQLLASDRRRDRAGMNTEAFYRAKLFAGEACALFTPSHHVNSRRRTNGAMVRCVNCQKPQHQHWLRQVLMRVDPRETPEP